MIRHHDVRMQLVAMESPLPIVQGRQHDVCDFRSLEIQRPTGAPVEQPIHSHECFAGPGQVIRREHSMCWKTAVQTERDKQRLIDRVPVRESPFVVPHLPDGVWIQKNSQKRPCDQATAA